jgi:hypothetical protein
MPTQSKGKPDRVDQDLKFLPVKLSDARRAELLQDLADASIDLRKAEREKADAVAELSQEVKSERGRVDKLSETLEKGEEERSVNCEIRFYLEGNVRQIVRMDTHEIIKVRAMTEEEIATVSQRELPPAKPTDV